MPVPDRKSLAVMFTDVAGFTARMERDEDDAMALLSRIREVLQDRLVNNAGELIKVMGDGTLSVFPTAPSAVRCARGLQKNISDDDFRVRIGIHWGDVLLDETDVYGDTVNVASRLEKIAAPGGICISGEMLNNYGSGRKPQVRPLGLRKLKGLGRLVDVFALLGTSRNQLPVRDRIQAEGVKSLVEEGDIPSLAVMLLENMGAVEDSFYAYGITTDLVSDLSRAGSISVLPFSNIMDAARSGSSPEEISARLQTRFLVRGALWRAERVFRLSIELHDMQSNALVWADSWEDEWFELPSIKGKLADGILKALGVQSMNYPGITKMESSESSAYELYLQGKHLYKKKHSVGDVERARKMLVDSLSKDPELVPACIILGTTYRDEGNFERARQVFDEAEQTALSKGDPTGQLRARNAIGITEWMSSDLKGARRSFQKVLRQAKAIGDRDGEAKALNNIGLIDLSMGRYRQALPFLEHSLRIAKELSASAQEARTLCNIGLVSWNTGKPQEALTFYRESLDLLMSLDDLAGQTDILRLMGIAHKKLGDTDRAMEIYTRAMKLARDIGDRPRLAKILNNMGALRAGLGMQDEAERYYEETLSIAREIGDYTMEGIVISNIGAIHYESRRFEEAHSLFREALGIYRETGDVEGEIDVLILIGNVRLYLGQEKDSLDSLRECLELIDRSGTDAERSRVHALMALALLQGESPPITERIEALGLAALTEENLPSSEEDRCDLLWILARVHSRLLELASTGDECRENHELRSRELTEEARIILMDLAERITDVSSRKTYLTRILKNREILEAARGTGKR